MANRKKDKVPIDRERFMACLQSKGVSIRQLGQAKDIIDRDEKTIRRYLGMGEMPPDLLDRIGRFINVHPDFLAGEYDRQFERKAPQAYDKEGLRALLTDIDRFPYFTKEQQTVDYKEYIKDTLLTQGVSEQQFMELSPDERITFQFRVAQAIDSVMYQFFSVDAKGGALIPERRSVEVLLPFTKDWYGCEADKANIHVTWRSLLRGPSE